MPQLDPSSYASQLFWLTVTFLFLYLMLARFIVPRIAGIIEGRQGRIDGDLAAAARFREEAEAARTTYEKSLQDTRASAQAVIAASQAQVTADATARLHALDQEMNAKLLDAQKTIGKTRDQALQDMQPAVVDLVAQIVEKITNHKADKQQVTSLVGDLTRKSA